MNVWKCASSEFIAIQFEIRKLTASFARCRLVYRPNIAFPSSIRLISFSCVCFVVLVAMFFFLRLVSSAPLSSSPFLSILFIDFVGTATDLSHSHVSWRGVCSTYFAVSALDSFFCPLERDAFDDVDPTFVQVFRFGRRLNRRYTLQNPTLSVRTYTETQEAQKDFIPRTHTPLPMYNFGIGKSLLSDADNFLAIVVRQMRLLRSQNSQNTPKIVSVARVAISQRNRYCVQKKRKHTVS